MNISETCREIIKEIDAKVKIKKIQRKQITYKVDEQSVMEALKFFNINGR